MKNINGHVKTGLEYLENEDYESAFETLLPCAKQGNPEAQANIGLMYQLGLGIQRDIKQAITWLSVAADQGRGEAAHNLGTLYLTCEPDMPVNHELSKSWFQRAKELNFIVANEEWYKPNN